MSRSPASPASARSGPSTRAYRAMRGILRPLLRGFYRFHVAQPITVPREGPVLLVANHQSYLDPPIIGCAVMHRHLAFIARRGLFESRVLGWTIRRLHAISIREDGSDASAIKEVFRRLGMGDAVVIFPEGSRTPDGAVTPLKRGVSLLVRRAKCPVIPVAVEGAFDAWPRSRRFPRLLGCRVAVAFGMPIDSDELMAAGPDGALDRLAREIDRLRLGLRGVLRERTGGRYPRAGPGDQPFSASHPPAPAEGRGTAPAGRPTRPSQSGA